MILVQGMVIKVSLVALVQILGRVYNTVSNTPGAFIEIVTVKILVGREAD